MDMIADCGRAEGRLSTLLTDNSDELLRIREPGVNLCVWQRLPAAPLADFIDTALLPLTIKRARTVDRQECRLRTWLQDLPGGPGLQLLEADIRALLNLYARVSDAKRIRCQLESLGDSLCGRFHADRVQLRLVCSYAGPGTEWLDNDAIDRSKLGPGSGGHADEVSGLIAGDARIRTLNRFEVGLMKGELWPGNAGAGLVHRSPTIKDAGVRRILLRIEGEC